MPSPPTPAGLAARRGGRPRCHAAGHDTEGLRDAVDSYAQAQDELVEARNRLARAIVRAAMSGLTQDEIVDLTGYPGDRVGAAD